MISRDVREKTADFYQVSPQGHISCRLCPQGCQIPAGQTGFCKVRRHQDNRLVAANYAEISSISLDPIEKKPLYHFYPGRLILSVGTVGCTLGCRFCQNWQIARIEDNADTPTRRVLPAELAGLAEQTSRTDGNIGLAYTYSEPGVWYEFLTEMMPRVREVGLKNVLVTNAFLNPEPWKVLLDGCDAANIDLKGFTEEFYRKMCHGRLQPVLDNIRAAVGKTHLELTTLIIPGENDGPEDMEKLAKWIAGLDPKIPLHLSRYFPNYQLNVPATPPETMERSAAIAREYLDYVYLGNIGAENDTFCPNCGALWVEREGYRTKITAAEKCPKCGREVDVVTY